jgi:membrane fusion protein (multidrug efflux system)
MKESPLLANEKNGSVADNALPRPRNKRRPFVVLAAVIGSVLAGVGVYTIATAGQEDTDDAQITSDVVPVATRVAGQIVAVRIEENQIVKKGDLLAEIDDADYAARARQAEAELSSAQAQAKSADAQVQVVRASSRGGFASAQAAVSGSSVGVSSASAQVAAANAAVARAEADLHKTQIDLDRAKQLRAAHAIPQDRLDAAQISYDGSQAALAQARAQLAFAHDARRSAETRVSEARGRLSQSAPVEPQIAVAEANAALAHARMQSAQASLDLARLQLSYTKILAPVDGWASKLVAHAGQLSAVGQPVVSIVPTATYVVANFKETQVGHMNPGQRAVITVDAYPGRKLEGRVQSFSGGTGATFSLIPSDNATGNFVKLVQRIPVRIAWVNPPKDLDLRAGYSVDVTVHLR